MPLEWSPSLAWEESERRDWRSRSHASWHHTSPGEPVSATYGDLIVDSFGQKWIIVLDEGNLNRVLGLLILDTLMRPSDTEKASG